MSVSGTQETARLLEHPLRRLHARPGLPFNYLPWAAQPLPVACWRARKSVVNTVACGAVDLGPPIVVSAGLTAVRYNGLPSHGPDGVGASVESVYVIVWARTSCSRPRGGDDVSQTRFAFQQVCTRLGCDGHLTPLANNLMADNHYRTLYEGELRGKARATFQVGHLALSRSPIAASRASATTFAWSNAVNLPPRRRTRPSTITVSTFVGIASETIAS
jgi:hypothetical protein